jgi:molecular chaperone DnaJ
MRIDELGWHTGKKAGGVVDHKGYYRILGLDSKQAPPAAIKAAFRKAAKRLHPDTAAHKSEHEAKRAKHDFHHLQVAYRILNDPNKRKKYDAGSLVEAET